MQTAILDTYVILRFLVGDDRGQFEKAQRWFREAEEGERDIGVSTIVIAEACFVLESFYQKSREDIADAMEVFLSQRWLQVEERDVLINLWPLNPISYRLIERF